MVSSAARLVDGRAHTIRQLFNGRQYRLEYYQRDYVWGRDQVGRLLSDLTRRFLQQWRPNHERRQVGEYDSYFLGPIVTYEESGDTYLTDGQQRLTTLFLLLVYVRDLLLAREDARGSAALELLLSSETYGEITYALDDPAYHDCIDAVFHGRSFDVSGQIAGARHIWECFESLSDLFPHQLREEALPYFTDWLLNRVSVVEIVAVDRSHGWEIFESMNDRGLRLTSLDLLKSYLLSRVDQDRDRLNTSWRRAVADLEFRSPSAPGDFVKTLLTAKYATPAGADDKALIDDAPHEWVRRNESRLGLGNMDGDGRRFIADVFVPLAGRFGLLLDATKQPFQGIESVFFNSVNGLTNQFTLTIAALRPDDSEENFKEKARLIANFLDLLFVLRVVNNRPTQSEDFEADIDRLVPLLRELDVSDVRTLLSSEISALEDDFSGLNTLRHVARDNRSQIRYLLARLTSWIDVGSGRPNLIRDYLYRDALGPKYQIEHIWSNHFERYESFAKTPEHFDRMRNQIGGLLLLLGPDNMSLGAATYEQKLGAYASQNMLAASLHPRTYERGFARFRRFIKDQGLSEQFRPYPSGFGTAISERTSLYRLMAERIWSPEVLGFARIGGRVSDGTPRQTTKKVRTRANYGVELRHLGLAGLLTPDSTLIGHHKGAKYEATVEEDFRIKIDTGEAFESPSKAAMTVLDRPSWNGWTFWYASSSDGPVRLDRLRAYALERGLLDSTLEH
ncbi:DUF262 domain-containing protein [Micromonospora echinofusca]|uniref:GmrSD restriction endonuclease domain-containing protein n=1 Tax=Micromonospora echinofusca TaxID=47858 RepID=UPI00340B94FD